MNVSDFLQKHFTSEKIQAAMEPPQPKIASLVEMIEKAKQFKGDSHQK